MEGVVPYKAASKPFYLTMCHIFVTHPQASPFFLDKHTSNNTAWTQVFFAYLAFNTFPPIWFAFHTDKLPHRSFVLTQSSQSILLPKTINLFSSGTHFSYLFLLFVDFL